MPDFPIKENHIDLKPHNTYNPTGTNTIYTIFLIVGASVGPAMLNFPKAFDEAGGILIAVTAQIILLAVIVMGFFVLVYTADRCGSGPAATLHGTMEGITGRCGRIVTSSLVALNCFGTCISLLIVIGDQLDKTFLALYGEDFYNERYMNRTFTIPTCACLFILPLCYSRRIDFLRVPSTLGVIAIFYLVGLIVYEYYAGNYKPGPIKTSPTRFMDVFLVVPNICFGYDGHIEVVSVYSCMKHRTFKNIIFVVFSAVTVCFVCYTLLGVYGYLTFGSLVNQDILMSYDGGGLVYAGMVAMALKSVTSYPVLLFCGREAIESFFTDLESVRATNIAASKIWHKETSTCLLYTSDAADE